jgi:oligopeptide/dipeptide ABC transporter ATP-binding protein
MDSAAHRSGDPIVEVEALSVDARLGDETRRVVDQVSFTLARGECLALVGESGSGKTLTAFSLLDLYPSDEIRRAGGVVRVDGQELRALAPEARRRLRGRRVAMVFQEPSQALNPVRRVGAHLREVQRAHGLGARSSWRERELAVLAEVGLPDPEAVHRMYPFELSGGMMQRVSVAMSLIADPEVLIADEPTTALDPTVSRRLIELFAHLRRTRGLSILYISHDLHWVSRLADRVGVMLQGRLVEIGPRAEVLAAPRHPYTAGLMGAMAREEDGRFRAIAGDPAERPPRREACGFSLRCPRARDACAEQPSLEGDEHLVACWAPEGSL